MKIFQHGVPTANKVFRTQGIFLTFGSTLLITVLSIRTHTEEIGF